VGSCIVTTNPNDIKNFLLTESDKVIFSTFHSLKSIVKAMKDTDLQFDLIFCDEAHKTTGADNKQTYGKIHDNYLIPAIKRVYATATPRVLSAYVKSKTTDETFIYDMNDKSIFGDVFYKMTFKEAIDSGKLVDYKIIALGVTDEEVANYLSNKYIGTEVADNYALDWVMNKYNVTHAISFHSTIKKAEFFKETHEHTFKKVKTFHINGEHLTSDRKQKLKDFKAADMSVISNVRCLTEGVDVPAIDVVYFCDPKNSKIDIIQSVGRALRKDENKVKEWGYIVIPIYHRKQDNIETIVKKSIFNNLINVIRSLYEQDERLKTEINNLVYNNKEANANSKIDFVGSDLESEKIALIGFDEKLKKSLFDEIIAKTPGWGGKYYLLCQYAEENNGNSNPLSRLVFRGENIGEWTTKQRTSRKKGLLTEEKIDLLNKINFDWRDETIGKPKVTKQETLTTHLQRLEAYYKIHNHSDVPAREPPNEKDKEGWSKLLADFVLKRLKNDRNWEAIRGNDTLTYNYKGEDIPVYKFLELVKYNRIRMVKSSKKIMLVLEDEKLKNPNFGPSDFDLLFKNDKDINDDVRRIRHNYKKYLDGDDEGLKYFEDGDIENLESLGFTWGYTLEQIEKERFSELIRYKRSEGTFDVTGIRASKLFFWCKRRKGKESLSLKKLIEEAKLPENWIKELISLDYNIT
jgi:superfamily II DNA or RNA helicase